MIRISLYLVAILSVGCRTQHCGISDGPACGDGAGASCRQQADSCRELHVNAPRQCIRVQRKAPAAEMQAVEQQVAQTRQVVLVPQQVYVPFVQATNFSAVRVSGTQQTQVFNAQGVAVQGAAGFAAAGAQGAASAQGVSVEETRAAKAELDAARAEIQKLAETIRALQAQLKPQ